MPYRHWIALDGLLVETDGCYDAALARVLVSRFRLAHDAVESSQELRAFTIAMTYCGLVAGLELMLDRRHDAPVTCPLNAVLTPF